jgi:S1-C subfamily serine protease
MNEADRFRQADGLLHSTEGLFDQNDNVHNDNAHNDNAHNDNAHTTEPSVDPTNGHVTDRTTDRATDRATDNATDNATDQAGDALVRVVAGATTELDRWRPVSLPTDSLPTDSLPTDARFASHPDTDPTPNPLPNPMPNPMPNPVPSSVAAGEFASPWARPAGGSSAPSFTSFTTPAVQFDPVQPLPSPSLPSPSLSTPSLSTPSLSTPSLSTSSFSTPPQPAGPSGPATSTPTSTPTSRKGGWLKPAFAGGLIGALLAGGISAATIVALDDDKSAVVAAATPAVVSSRPATPQPASVPTGAAGQGSGEGTNVVKQAFGVVKPSVVSISTKGFNTIEGFGRGIDPAEGAGSGVIISPDGLILTNAHVVRGATAITVTFSDRTTKQAALVGSSRSNDVALIKIQDASNLPAATLGDSSLLEVGDQVVAVGNALALEGGPTVTSGIVSALDREISDGDISLQGLIQTDAPINPGNSGGPLVNAAGEVVGMNTAIIQNSNNIGFAIAVNEIKPLITDIQNGKGGLKTVTFMGVRTDTVTPELRSLYSLPVDTGAFVLDVTAGSPAENVGLEAGDIVVKFGDATIASSRDLQNAVRARKPKEAVTIEWWRGPVKQQGSVVLGQTTSQ